MRPSLFVRLITAVVLLFGLSLFMGGRWGDIKLKAVPYLSYLTLRNNPLLRGSDADLVSATGGEALRQRIDRTELLSGGPPKDGIPALDNPRFDTAATTPFTGEDLILGVVLNGEAKAYPYGILNWHEIVNDIVGGVPVTITYCPLCDTGITFERRVNGRTTTFGVSGKLYQSCLVMYDRLTDSLWSQPWGTGIFGNETNSVLNRLPTYKTTLGAWLEAYPQSAILSTGTGYSRDYFRYPYGTYFTNSQLIFPVRNVEKITGHVKESLYIIWEADEQTPMNRFSGKRSAFFLNEIEKRGIVNGTFGDVKVAAFHDRRSGAVRIFETTGEVERVGERSVIYRGGGEEKLDTLREVPTTAGFAFVYPAFFE